MIERSLSQPVKTRDALALGTLRVELIADLVCPWSYLGKRRLDAALAAVQGPTELRWLPYQLNPDMPADGMPFEAYLRQKFGDSAKVRPGLEELTRVGAEEGIRFRFDRLDRVPNTLNAHRLLHFAEEQGAATGALAESLWSGFFESGRDIADRDVLIEIGKQHGLGRAGILTALESREGRDDVLEQEARVRQSGVTGVPNFLVNRRLMVLGAQPKAVLVDAFDRAMFGDESDLPLSGTLH